jgi:hypothetical protein
MEGNMTKIVIGIGYHGFDLPHKFVTEYANRKGIMINLYRWYNDKYTKVDTTTDFNELDYGYYVNYLYSDNDIETVDTKPFYKQDISRDDIDLINIIEENLEVANEFRLKVVEIPDDVEWSIGNYGWGSEFIMEKHRTWS